MATTVSPAHDNIRTALDLRAAELVDEARAAVSTHNASGGRTAMDFFDSNSCDHTFHVFARDGEEDGKGNVAAYHVDGDFYRVCEAAEFCFAAMLNDELPVMHECPWCLRLVDNTDHVRRCSNYAPAPTADEIRDAYSDPTERAKRDRLLEEVA